MKIFIFTLFASMALVFPLNVSAASDVEDVTMTMIDDDDTSHEGSEIDIPGGDDGPNHDLDEDHSASSSDDDDADHDSDDDENENDSDDDENETEDAEESEEIEDSEDDTQQPNGGAGGSA
ncbi:hypothetical protein MNBD_GAMMA22-373 [hydrothermal vent metagenome]|uniref:Uncharacterized protein n=1 Tax=hydrothermal vent metagenome TaxID=652676 RepID=A0A3B1AD59_9ZZZZ